MHTVGAMPTITDVSPMFFSGHGQECAQTQVMVKNVPIKCGQRRLLRQFLGAGFQGKLDPSAVGLKGVVHRPQKIL